LESEKPVIDFARVRTFTWVIGVGSSAGARRGRGDHRPDPAPFPADDGTPSRLWTIHIGRQLRAQNGWGGGYGGSATGEVQRLSARGRWAGESPPPPSHRTPLDNRSTLREGCAPVKTQTCNATEGRHRQPDAGYGRPQARRRTMAVSTFDVCSNAAVNSDLSCFLYTL